MSLHPIKILNNVLDEYRDYLRTEFRARDPRLRAALETELNAPGFLAQVPFYQAHRPFKDGRKWRGLSLDARLARVMEKRSGSERAYLHQSLAIDELLSDNPAPVVVTTGTGSGKTEAFLLPVIQNAFNDAVQFKRSGITAILVYPMNALANDQKIRIEKYLDEAGIAGAIQVEQYDRGTSQVTRKSMRENPPHILLTNYMMLEYLLVRPADRDNIFANHRCRFLVFDEVHTYRGMLGSNIALLTRRLRAHLSRARQDWKTDTSEAERLKRFPALVPVATSATIKSVSEEDLPHDEKLRQRDEAVKHFFSELTGCEKTSIQVFGEELKSISVPQEALYPATITPVDLETVNLEDPESLRVTLCRLVGIPETTTLADAVRKCRLLWDLNQLLIAKPMSVTNLVTAVKSTVPERNATPDEQMQSEIMAALTIGSALPENTAGVLRLRAHQFIRGGWKFYRCIDPTCGRIYPRGEERCACGHDTAPLYLCRNCGADYLRFSGDPDSAPLIPDEDESVSDEWLLCDPSRFDVNEIEEDDDSDSSGNSAPQQTVLRAVPSQIRNRPVHQGSFDPYSKQFSNNLGDYPWRVWLAPARSRCLCCGGTAGSRNVLTSVALGTSAAVKVLSEGLVESLHSANSGRPEHDGKERLLIFSDSRQDAAHQARFIYFAGRYDRMRRRVVSLLREHESLTIQRTVELLGELAVRNHDNPFSKGISSWVPTQARNKIQAWEEVPLLDEIAVNPGYRGSFLNLGLVGIRYDRLDEYVQTNGQHLASRLNISLVQLEYICRIILDEVRINTALSRRLLRYHPSHPSAPEELLSADWERRVKQPRGLPISSDGHPITNIDSSRVPTGVSARNVWRRQGAGGSSPKMERLMKLFLNAFGGIQPDEPDMVAILSFLVDPGMFLIPVELFGARDSFQMLQLNEETITLYLLDEANRMHCSICGEVRAGAPADYPCSRCDGILTTWSDSAIMRSRSVKRIIKSDTVPLIAGEHTAQVTSDAREKLENDFKAAPAVSPINVLACSPTLEMGIDVGGLDAVVMRNVPPPT
jgi:hypothetical protein